MISSKFENGFNRQSRDEQGFFALSPVSFAADTGLTPVSVTVECPGSWDSVEVWVFADRSKARIANPRQGAFPGDVTVLR